MLANKNLPNIISCLRIAGTVCLLLMKPLSALFLVIYTLTGLSDVLDGAIARRYGTTSELGARLDSIADLLFYTLILIRILPVMWVVLPKVIWVAVGAVLAVRITAYLTAAFRHKCFSSMHTYMNKLTGFMVFGVPYAIISPISVPYCWCVVAVAMAASLEELVIHITSKEYDSKRKMLIWKSLDSDFEKQE